MDPEGVVRPSGSVAEMEVLVAVEDEGNTPLSGDWAVTGRAATTQRVRSNNVFVLGNEDMMFSSAKWRGRTDVDCRSECDHCTERSAANRASGKGRAHPRFGR